MVEQIPRTQRRRTLSRAVDRDKQSDGDDRLKRGVRSSDAEARMPHERDEYPDPQDDGMREAAGPRAVLDQASRDVDRGLRDTERRGVPSDVPAPAEESQGDTQFESARTSPRRQRTEDQR
jgi:hypothetical protein